MLEKMEMILYPGPEADYSENLTDWSLAKDLSYYEIWFKSVDNFFQIW